MANFKEKIKSVQFKLFSTMCIVIAIIVLCLILANNVVLETFYIYSKTKNVKQVYERINGYYEHSDSVNIEKELRRIAFNNNFDIFIKTEENVYIFSTDRDFYNNLNNLHNIENLDVSNNDNVLYKDEKVVVTRVEDTSNNMNYILLTGNLDNGYSLYIRIPIVPIEESGIVVFIGEKEGYNNTVIIQRIDGIDEWYGNIENVNVNNVDEQEIVNSQNQEGLSENIVENKEEAILNKKKTLEEDY